MDTWSTWENKANSKPIKANSKPIKANKMPKQTQYKAKQSQFQRQKVLLPGKSARQRTQAKLENINKVINNLLDQLRQFPLGKHDDGPDALEMAI